jgi:hypothetical protein
VRLEDRKFCETRTEGCHAKWGGDLVGVIPFFLWAWLYFTFLPPAVYWTHPNHSCWSISYNSCLLFRIYHKHRNISRNLTRKMLGSAHIVGNVLWHSLFHLATSTVKFIKQSSETGLRFLYVEWLPSHWQAVWNSVYRFGPAWFIIVKFLSPERVYISL